MSTRHRGSVVHSTINTEDDEFDIGIVGLGRTSHQSTTRQRISPTRHSNTTSPRSPRRQQLHRTNSDSMSVSSSISTQSTSLSSVKGHPRHPSASGRSSTNKRSSRRKGGGGRRSSHSRRVQERTEFIMRLLSYTFLGFLLFVLYDFVMDTIFGDSYNKSHPFQEDLYFGPALGMDYQTHYHPSDKLNKFLQSQDDDAFIKSPAGTSKEWDVKFFSQGTTDDYDYNEIYESNGDHAVYHLGSANDNNTPSINTITHEYTSPDIMEHGCDLTVVLMDPRLSDVLSFQDALWYSLESVATYAPYACVLLQTSSCGIERELAQQRQKSGDNGEHSELLGGIDDNNIDQAVSLELSNRLYKHVLPLFRQMMLRGQVRYTILNHTKYGLPSCDNFYNPSSNNNKALMNVHFWGSDEFAPEDSDHVLMVQSDAVLCHNLLAYRWMDVAFVGAPWPRDVDHRYNPDPAEGMCLGMPLRAKMWFLSQKRLTILEKRAVAQQQMDERERQGKTKKKVGAPAAETKQEEEASSLLRGAGRITEALLSDGTTSATSTSSLTAPPLQILDTSTIMSNICSNGQGPVGNGGLSLRSRQWMRHAIQTCPNTLYSGVEFYKDSFDNPLYAKPMTTTIMEEEAHKMKLDKEKTGPLELERQTVNSMMKVPPDTHQYACKVTEDVGEDFYFATVLAALGAPLPTAYEASLFSLEMMWPDQVAGGTMSPEAAMYGPYAQEELDGFQRHRFDRRTNISTRQQVQGDTTTTTSDNKNVKAVVEGHHIMPLGMHKPWWYHPNDMLRQKGGQVERECKFLKYLFKPNESKWRGEPDWD
jgi:hypothetical protein